MAGEAKGPLKGACVLPSSRSSAQCGMGADGGDSGVCPGQVGFRRAFLKLSGSSLMLVPHLVLYD